MPEPDTLNIIIEGKKENSIINPDVLRTVEMFEETITSQLPDVVGGTQSMVGMIQKLNKEYHEGDPRWQTLPVNKKLNALYVFLYRSAGDPEDFGHFSDPLYKEGNIIVFFKDHRGDTLKRAMKIAEDFFQKTFGLF